ncbi:MAG: HPF/RaiA family ribosome-associated protein [Saprospiraceae bacterium]|nr:HPF/RaiA family ribosome-associated protein [Saprospiraceae bacterium]
MNIIIEAPFKISENDREIIHSKLQYLSRYESRITQINVFFKNDGGNLKSEVVCEIRILVPGNDLFAESSDPIALKAFSRAYSAIKRRVKERRKKLNDHQSPIREINELVNNTY